MRRALILVALPLLLGACSETTSVTAADNESSITIEIGDELEVVLGGNPSTGFSWIVTSNDPAVLEPVGDPVFDAETDLLGAPGEFRFRFLGVAEGTVTLELSYERPFEDTEPEQTFTLDVIVG